MWSRPKQRSIQSFLNNFPTSKFLPLNLIYQNNLSKYRFQFHFSSFLIYQTLFSVLFYTVLFCSLLFYSILFSCVLFYSVLFSSVLLCSVLFCSLLFCSILFCSLVFCPLLILSLPFSSPIILPVSSAYATRSSQPIVFFPDLIQKCF